MKVLAVVLLAVTWSLAAAGPTPGELMAPLYSVQMNVLQRLRHLC